MSGSPDPNCNKSTGVHSNGAPSCADRAAEAMAKHAAYRDEESTLERIRRANIGQQKPQQARWLKHSDLT